jgi:predicted TIM-barrel fold metal-dependent hydrolase
MIIDAHSHWPQGRHSVDRLPTCIEDLDGVEPDSLIATLDGLGIEKVVSLAQQMARVRDTWLGSNALARDLQARFPDRFLAFAAVEPITARNQFNAANFEEVRELLRTGAVSGLLITPPYGHFALSDRRAYPYFQMADELRVPIYVHQGAMFGPTENAPQFRSQLSHVDRVVVDFPNLRLNIEHMAWPWSDELLAIMAHAPNVHTDVCMLLGRPRMLAWNLTMAKEYGFLDRVFWGTDYVGTSNEEYEACVRREVQFLRSELNPILDQCGWPQLSEPEVEGLLAENVRRFLAGDVQSLEDLSVSARLERFSKEL